MADSQLFDDTFTITGIDQKKYDRVSRITCQSTDNTTSMTLDINHELYPVANGESVQMVLATTLNLDGTKDEKGWRELSRAESTLADMYDYVCHGKIYRFDDGENDIIKVYASFGGLLLYLEGPYKKLTSLRIDYIYMLLKK